MTSALLYAILATALFYLGSRAVITRWLWSHYPPRFAAFMDCAACSGFWYGVITATVLGWRYNTTFMFLAGRDPITPFVVGFFTLVTTPILGGLMQFGFDTLGSIVEERSDSDG